MREPVSSLRQPLIIIIMAKINEIWVFPRTATPKNTYTVFLAYVSSSDDEGTLRRILKHRGIQSFKREVRQMNAEEINNSENAWRMRFHTYDDWHSMIEDEWRITKNREWIDRLISFSNESINAETLIEKVNKNP